MIKKIYIYKKKPTGYTAPSTLNQFKFYSYNNYFYKNKKLYFNIKKYQKNY